MEEFLLNIATLFGETPKENFNSDTIFKELEEWDSIQALFVMEMINQNYNIKISSEDIKKSITLSDLFSHVIEKM